MPSRLPGPPSDPPNHSAQRASWHCWVCDEWWTGVAYGGTCPDCGAVRFPETHRPGDYLEHDDLDDNQNEPTLQSW